MSSAKEGELFVLKYISTYILCLRTARGYQKILWLKGNELVTTGKQHYVVNRSNEYRTLSTKRKLLDALSRLRGWHSDMAALWLTKIKKGDVL